MRRVVSFVLIAFVFSSLASSAHAQKSRGVSASTLQSTSAKSTVFANIAAFSDGKGVWLTWDMELEVGNIGFNVYRLSRQGTELMTPVKMIGGAALHGREIPQSGRTYYFYDRSPVGPATYFVEALSLKGSRVATPAVSPRYVPSLSSFTGMSTDEMERRGGSSMPAAIENEAPKYTKELYAEMQENRQLSDSPTHRMVISQPGVVRIGVKKTGFYRVPKAQLLAAGFDVTTDPGLWQLYFEGVQQAIIVGPNGDYVEFYGTGIDTFETDVRQYYLMNGAFPGKRIETRVAHSNTSTVVSSGYQQLFVKHERLEFTEDIFNGDEQNYMGRGISTGFTAPLTFNLNNVDFSQPNATMQLTFQGYSDVLHLIEPTLNDQVLAPASGFDLESFTATYAIPSSILREGVNSIKFRAVGPTGDFVFFNTIKITFGRAYVAEQNKLDFYTPNYKIAKLNGFTSPNVRVFDMTREGNPVLVTNLTFQQNGTTFGTNMPASRGRSFYAVEDSAILAPDSVTTNKPDIVSDPSNASNLVIIAHKNFLTQAEAWATYRRGQGFSVKVVDVDEIYDEFNYGVISSNSIKAYLQYVKENWQAPGPQIQYVLLIGDASWDARNYEGEGYLNFVPPRMVATVYTETASDEALTDFDGDGLAEIPIGRIPARTPGEVTTVFSKTTNWESNLTPTSLNDRGALFAYDFNSGYTFDAMSNRLRNQLAPEVPSTFVYRGEVNANTNLINAMNTGKFVVNYSGHGTPGSWGGNPLFFNVFSVPTTQDHSPGIYTMLTCLNGYYQWLWFPSMAEVLLNAQNRGAVAAWASSGLTQPNYQEEMAARFYSKLNGGTIPRMGDLVRDAKLALVFPFNSPDVRLSWNLLGDPMLKVR